MKRILHVLNTGSYSGAENVVITIIKYYQSTISDYKMIYVSLNGSIKERLDENNIIFEPISSLNIKEIRRVINKFQPAIIHAHDFTASIICAFASKRVPVISHIHNNSPWIKSFCPKSIIYGLSCFKYRAMLGVSPSVFDEYIFGKFFKKKEHIIGNPFSIDSIRRLAREDKTAVGADIIFIGRLSAQKNIFRLLRILSLLQARGNNYSSVIVGDGELRTDVERQIEEFKLNNIRLMGFLKNPYGILSKCKVLCITSDWEGYGLVAVEALALGIPVVATGVGGLPRIIDETCGKICVSDDDFINEIEHLLLNSEYYNKKKSGALNKINKLNNDKDYFLSMNRIYDSFNCRKNVFI